MGIFTALQPARETAAETLDRASEAARRAVRSAGTVADRVSEQTAALGRRGTEVVEATADAVRARPLTAIAIVTAVAAVAAAAATYFATRGRE